MAGRVWNLFLRQISGLRVILGRINLANYYHRHVAFEYIVLNGRETIDIAVLLSVLLDSIHE